MISFHFIEFIEIAQLLLKILETIMGAHAEYENNKAILINDTSRKGTRLYFYTHATRDSIKLILT